MKTISLEHAVSMIPDGASLMIGGFMAAGTPERVIDGSFVRRSAI
jgi:acetate CoA/acetoacetate CoA-transferase alpha subunit